MSLVKIRRPAQITLPADVRRALDVDAGDYLEMELVAGGVLLKPAAVGKRADAWQRIDKARRTVRPTPEQAAKPTEEQEREIVEEVNEIRREYAQQRRRR